MRSFKKRKFSSGRRFGRKFHGSFKRKSKVLNTTPSWKPNRTDQLTTTLSFKGSLNASQPVPDRYLTWLTYENAGFITGALSAASYSWGINNVVAPFGTANTGTTTIPNPFVAVATGNPLALKNLLFNASTGTGLWERARVWMTRIDVECATSTSTSGLVNRAVQIGMAPIIGSTSSYASVTSVSSGPKAKAMTMISGAKPSMLSAVYSIPALLGVKKSQFAGPLVGSDQSFTSVPTQYIGLQFGFADACGTNLGGDCFSFRIRMQMHIEFYNRVDTALLQ